ncbi:unnamed protein product [Phytophthora lilii]|uniref:Unnamed protein product n=1 Tax=Phytophthora lilii TaxID=2077276 RepID=A0A9W6TH45_9STRA|nr:unnamed protein product [Phytophthora lilii]
MFPNFTSLQQRESKRLELLEKVQRRYRQRETQRDMYAEAIWATDADKTVSLSKLADSDIKKNSNEQKVGDSNAVNDDVEPMDTDDEVWQDAMDSPDSSVHDLLNDIIQVVVTDTGTQATPSTTDAASQAYPSTSDAGQQYRASRFDNAML